MKRNSVVRVAAGSLLPVLAAGAACGQSFTGLGVIPGGTVSFAYGISADGQVVVGRSDNANGQVAMRWTRPGGGGGGMVSLGVLPIYENSVAHATSADGSTVVGECNRSGSPMAFRWTAASGMQAVGVIPGGLSSDGRAVSADGSVVAGSGDTGGYLAYRGYLSIGGSIPGSVGILPGASDSTIQSISANGGVIAGECAVFPYNRAFISIGGGPLQDLGTLPGGNNARAYGISGNGLVAVGVSNGTTGSHAFRWTSAGMEDLGSVPALLPASAALGVNADGSVIVGYNPSASGPWHAAMWTAALGMVDLNAYLPTLGLNLSGWTLVEAYGVSADGRTIAGNAVHNGASEAWVAVLSAPPCYANCDGSTTAPLLNVLDFGCFLNKFAAGDTYANCDGSTVPPVLNVLDFGCFLNRFAAGCA